VTQVWSIVVAGGSGQRFGQLKQFAALGGRPVVAWSIAACRPSSTGVVLVLPAGSEDRDPLGAEAVVEGGATRAASVRCGLAAVPAEADVIVVHDAARPLASPGLFAAVVDAVVGTGADGAVPGLPPSDTIKTVDAAGHVITTLDRTTLVAVQTPQAFRADVLRRAHDDPAASSEATDDAMLVEALGGVVQVVPGEPENLKITAPDDLGTAERLLAERPA
jgi:2-C-methyl-D-erythritol 4-phosphate cytidylyltransferase